MDFQDLKNKYFISQVNRLKETGLKAMDIAAAMGIEQQHLSNYMNGRRSVSDGVINKLFAAYSIEPVEVFSYQVRIDQPHTEELRQKKGVPLLPQEYAQKVLEGKELPATNELLMYKIPSMLAAGFLMQVHNDEMAGEYINGDLVAIQVLPKDTFYQPNKVYALATVQGIFLRRVKPTDNGFILSSVNAGCPDFELKLSDITGVGLVLGLIRIK